MRVRIASFLTLPRLLKPLGNVTCPGCGATMVQHGDRYKCNNCGTLL